MAASAPPASAAPARHPTEVLVVLSLACIAYALAQTMVVPALPALREDLDASVSASSWILTGYLLSASVATPIVGKLGDVLGKGRVLCAVLVVFSCGSVLCALAGSVEVVIAGRVVQGVAGGVFPLAFGIVRDTFPRERVGAGIGLISAIFGIGGGIGLPLSGIVVANLDLAWLFWIGPLAALPAALAAYLVVPASPVRARVRIDWLGAFILSLALLCVLLSVTQAADWGWTSARTLGLLATGLALAVAWIAVERRVRDPLIDLRVLRRRTVAATNLSGLLVGFAMFSSFLIIPQFAEAPESTGYGFGFSVTESGLVMVPSAFAQLLAGPLAGRLGDRFGFRAMLAQGTALASIAFGLLVLAHQEPWHFVLSGLFLGVGITLAFSAMANLVVGAVDQADVGIATGINTITRTVGGAFGAAVATAILTSDTLAGSGLPTEHAYVTAFALAALGGVLALLATSLIPGGGGPPLRRRAVLASS
jgi:EmrB/QacA subfamily drug resistance transporter